VGLKCSEEKIKNIKLSMKNPEVIKKMRKPKSEETIQKMKNHIFSKEHKKHLSEAGKGKHKGSKGFHHTEEFKHKRSEAMKGNLNPMWKNKLHKNV
jgi:hypothetical protein